MEWNYEFDPNGINHIIEEGGNSFSAIRMVKWSKDAEDYKLDFRKYMCNEHGEIAKKGISFYHPQEASTEIIKGLLHWGYGDANEVAKCIYQGRPDIVDLIVKLNSGEMSIDDIDCDSEDFYDPREMVV